MKKNVFECDYLPGDGDCKFCINRLSGDTILSGACSKLLKNVKIRCLEKTFSWIIDENIKPIRRF